MALGGTVIAFRDLDLPGAKATISLFVPQWSSEKKNQKLSPTYNISASTQKHENGCSSFRPSPPNFLVFFSFFYCKCLFQLPTSFNYAIYYEVDQGDHIGLYSPFPMHDANKT